jgi:hypothetical protein
MHHPGGTRGHRGTRTQLSDLGVRSWRCWAAAPFVPTGRPRKRSAKSMPENSDPNILEERDAHGDRHRQPGATRRRRRAYQARTTRRNRGRPESWQGSFATPVQASQSPAGQPPATTDAGTRFTSDAARNRCRHVGPPGSTAGAYRARTNGGHSRSAARFRNSCQRDNRVNPARPGAPSPYLRC